MTTKPRRPGAPSRPIKDLDATGKLLRQIRGERTLEEIATLVAHQGKPRSADWWHDKETGRREVSLSDLRAIAKGLRLTWTIDAAGKVGFAREGE